MSVKCSYSFIIIMFFFLQNLRNIPKACAVKWALVWVGALTTEGLRCSNGRALRHPYWDYLVPYLTGNGFGPLINSDEWRPIHNPLCTWPHVLSVLQDLKTAPATERGQLLPPVGQGCSLAALGNVYFRLQISTEAEFSSRPWCFQATDGWTRQWHTQVVN